MGKFKAFIEKEEIKLGVISSMLEGRVSVVESILKSLNTVLQNPIIDGVLEVVLPPSITSHLPQLEAILSQAITDLMAGTKIADDINAQTTTEGKLKVFLTDIQSCPQLKNAVVKEVCSKILAAIDHNALDANLYSIYLQIEETINK